MQNLWQRLVCDDVRKTQILLGTDKKYLNGEASDFEAFREFCASFYLLDGNETAEEFAKKLSELIGKSMTIYDIKNADAASLWQAYNAKEYDVSIYDEKHKTVRQLTMTKKTDENLYNYSDCLDLNLLAFECLKSEKSSLDFSINTLRNAENKYIVARFDECEFTRPNAYLADGELKKAKCGEKYNINLILSQLILELIYSKKCRKIQLIADFSDNLEFAKAFVNYLRMRDLKMRIYVLCDSLVSPESIVDLCLCGDTDIFITPILTYTKSCPKLLSRSYPQGLVGYVYKKEVE